MHKASRNCFCCWDCDWLLADPAQPVRRSSRGAKHRAAGIARRAFPWRQAKRRGREGIGIGRSKKKWRVARKDDAPGC